MSTQIIMGVVFSAVIITDDWLNSNQKHGDMAANQRVSRIDSIISYMNFTSAFFAVYSNLNYSFTHECGCHKPH
jgi:hypothetical protein